jgi:PKD repeat protein
MSVGARANGSGRVGSRRKRRLLATLAGLALVVSGLAASGSSPAVADSAPQDPQDPETPATVTADALPTVQINGVVWSQAVVGNRVYAGGSFTTARPPGGSGGTVSRTHLLAYDITTGALVNGFAPTLNGQVLSVALSPDQTRLYVGGEFTTVNGQTRRRIAAFNAATGALITSFAPPVNYDVHAIVATNTTVYAGGNFGGVGNQNRANLAAFNASNGALLNWAPQATGGYVWSMAMNPAGTKIAVGGSFTALNGSSNPGYGLGMVDATTGASLPMAVNNYVRNGTADGAITTLTADAENVYGGGYTFGKTGGTWEGMFAASWDGGAVTWLNDCHGDSYSMHAQGDVVYTASHTHYCENIDGIRQGDGGVGDYPYFRAVAMGVEPTGTVSWEPDQGRYYSFEGQPRSSVLTWYPNLNAGTYTGQSQGPWSVAGNSDYIVMGGEFTRVNGQNQQGLVRFAKPSIAPNDRGPTLFNTTYPLNVSSTEAGKVRINWTTNEDIDNDYLTYRLYRDDQNGSGLIHSRSVRARWWNHYGMGFTDTGVAPGSTHRYRVAVTDPFGNIANSPWTTVTVASTGSDSAYVEAVEASEPTHWWRFGEASGTTSADSAGFRPLTSSGSVTRGVAGAIPSDPDNRAIRFPGASTARAYTTTIDDPPDLFTVEAWFRTTSLTGGKIIGRGNRNTSGSSKHDRQLYLNSAGQLAFGVKPNASRLVVTSPGTYRDGAWHHAVASLSPAGMKLYVDGVLRAQRADVQTAEHLARGYWRIGGDTVSGWPSAPLSGYLNGDIDEVAIYKRALSDAEVAAHYGAGTGAPVPNFPPTASFTTDVDDLDVSVASTSTDSDGTIVDTSWNWGDGSPASSGTTATHTYASAGSYTITLTVTDDDGATHSTTAPVVVSPNQAPVAAFTVSQDGLGIDVDSAGSSDPGGTIVSRSWDWGDGSAPGSGTTASHVYPAADTYTVTLTVTDDDGATGQVSQDVTVSGPPPPPAPFASDAFERTVANGWGAADLGGAWARSGSAANFAVSSGRGTIRMGSPGAGPGMQLPAVSSTDTEMRVRLGTDKPATGGGVYLTVQPRLMANGDRYTADVRLLSSGAAALILSRVVGGAEVTLQTITVPGLSITPGELVEVRVQATGTSPTTLRAKAWAAGDPEPTDWTASVTDNTAALQVPGAIGLRTYLSGSATNAPVVALFDDLWAGPTQ